MSLLDDASLLVTPNARKEGKLYSIIPTNGNGDFSVTRATTATRVNAAGLVELVPYNLLTYSEMFSNAAWTKAASSVTPNITTAPNGTLTADSLIEDNTNAVHQTIQSTPSAGGVYTSSVYLKPNGRNWVNINIAAAANYGAWFDLQNGVTGTIQANITSATITSVGDGWYRCTLTANTGAIAPRMSLTLSTANNVTSYLGNGTSGVFLWGAQLVEGTSALDYQMTETRLNIPRLDYSLGSCPNILLEPQRTNLALRSEEFDNAYWVKTAASVTANLTTSPSGIQNADKFIENVGISSKYLSTPSFSAGTYTASIYVKPSNKTFFWMSLDSSVTACFFNLTTGTIAATGIGNTATITNVGNGWYRCSITLTNAVTRSLLIGTSDSSLNYTSNGNGVDGVFLWGAQLEAGAYATSYIPTSSASVTRNADVISRGNIFTNGLITASGGTWFVDLRGNSSVAAATTTELCLGIGATSTGYGGAGSLSLWNFSTSATRIQILKQVGGVFTNLYTTTTDTSKIAIKWNGTTADVFVNGVKVIAATSFTPTAMEFFFGSGARRFTNINSMALFPTPLTDTQCIALTT
jgi:hypothetical protein